MSEQTSTKQELFQLPIIQKKEYHVPRLKKLGDIRDLTLAVSGGIGESGSPETRREF